MSEPKRVKKKPILFQAEMVRAILGGRKKQTRRLIKPEHLKSSMSPLEVLDMLGPQLIAQASVYCPYGQPGDRLWVKEEHYQQGAWFKNGLTKRGWQKWRFEGEGNAPHRIAFDRPEVLAIKPAYGWYKRNSLFMPRWASRITLEVTKVRVERLQDISEADAQAEGCEMEEQFPKEQPHSSGIGMVGWDSAIEWYSDLWESINGKGSWALNPWVWVVEFKRYGN